MVALPLIWGNHPEICIAISEYGAGASIYHQQDSLVKTVPTSWWHPENWQTYYHIENWKTISSRPYVWGSFVWNMFDFGCAARNEGGVRGRNNKGLVTIDRKTRKDSFYVYQAYWSKEPMVHIAGRRHAQRAGETTEVKIYSNQDSVTLDEGINILLAVTDKVKDSITLEKVEKEPDSYTLPEFNERQEGVANWFKQMGSLDLKAPMEFPVLSICSLYLCVEDYRFLLCLLQHCL